MTGYGDRTVRKKTDILIVGGGISGLSAAITAKQSAPELSILVVDKAAASKGFAGKAGRTTGLLSYVTQEDDPEEFAAHCVREHGCYLNDQELLLEMAYNSRRIVSTIAEWGIGIQRGEEGKVAYAKWPTPWGTAAIDPDMCRTLAKKAKELDVEFLDHVAVAALMRNGRRVVGAAGFDHRNGDVYIFEAGAVILAAGAQDYLITTGWCGTGNGIWMAYEVGAEMRNAEFGNMCDFARVAPDGSVYYGAHGGAHIAHDHLHTKKENISRKYRPGFHSSMDPLAAYAWYRETLDGNGPVFVDLSDFAQKEGVLFQWHPTATARRAVLAEKTNPPENKRFDVVPGFLGEMSCVSVDHDMATTVPGLYCVGDNSGSGSARGGAVPTPPGKIHGTGILNAFFTGMKGGPAAAQYAKGIRASGVSQRVEQEQIDAVFSAVFQPMERETGYDVKQALDDIQDIVAPVDYSLIQTETRLQRGLREAVNWRARLGQLYARDYHEVLRCLDLQAMGLCAELFFRASLMRKESRGFHFREDYPETDNQNWLKWIIIRKNGTEMELLTRDIPIDRYPVKPEGKG